jgi:hypothetical protein
MSLVEIEWDWIDLARDRGKWKVLVCVIMNLQVL